jgi:putative holliday junction resolvase
LKILALDYGSARTGVAVSDPTGTVARPVTTVQRAMSDDGFAKLLTVISAQARETAVFVERLRGSLSVPVDEFDERFTSVLAGGDDARAAAHLLSGYLEWRATRA